METTGSSSGSTVAAVIMNESGNSANAAIATAGSIIAGM